MIEVVGTASNGKIGRRQGRRAPARPRHPRHRDAGDERARGLARDPQDPSTSPGHHVLHADPVRRLGDARRTLDGRVGLRDQAGERRQHHPGHAGHPERADPQGARPVPAVRRSRTHRDSTHRALDRPRGTDRRVCASPPRSALRAGRRSDRFARRSTKPAVPPNRRRPDRPERRPQTTLAGTRGPWSATAPAGSISS